MTTVNRWFSGVRTRIERTEAHLPFHLFCLVLGFFLGNLFGTFLAALRQYISSDILIILLLCLLFEYISAQVYTLPAKPFPGFRRPLRSSTEPVARFKSRNWRALSRRAVNLMKVGCLFGFFVDAFKVGS